MPNQTLMSADINNVTQSQEMQDRLVFEVDSYNFTPELCVDLASRAATVMELEPNRHLFDVDFVPFSYIVAVTNPLKYQVLALARPVWATRGWRLSRGWLVLRARITCVLSSSSEGDWQATSPRQGCWSSPTWCWQY